MGQLKQQLLPLLLSVMFGVLTLQPVRNVQAQSTPEDEPPFISGGLAWSPDGETIAVGTSEGVWLHSATDLTPIEQLLEFPLVTALDWSPDNRIVVSSDDVLRIREDADIQVLDVTTREVVFDLRDQGSRVTSVRWSPDATMFAAALENGFIHIYDAQTGQLIQSIELGRFSGCCYPLTWSPDSQQVATYIYNGEHYGISIWNVETGDIDQSWTDIYASHSIAWKPYGNIIAVAGSDGFVRLWDTETGELQYTLDADESVVMALVWSPIRGHLATIGRYESSDTPAMTRVWNGILSPHLLTEFVGGRLWGEGFYTNAIAWSPDDTRLASISDDGKIYLWDMQTYEQIAVYEGYRSILRSN
jgi:WD40 repeat protein